MKQIFFPCFFYNFQIFNFLSSLPLITKPLRSSVIHTTLPLCPSNVPTHSIFSTSQIFNFLSSLPETEDDDLYVFGEDIFDGSDENHFHLGLTSVKLLQRINELKNNGCFHIDATCRIVKYSYPLIVFRLSDIERKFFPLAFMFTTYEQQEDYDHFFMSHINECNRFNINFNP